MSDVREGVIDSEDLGSDFSNADALEAFMMLVEIVQSRRLIAEQIDAPGSLFLRILDPDLSDQTGLLRDRCGQVCQLLGHRLAERPLEGKIDLQESGHRWT